MASDESSTILSSVIPTGPWTLYFHSTEETKWTLNTFISLGSMKTWQQFWIIMDTLKTDSFSDGMFFLMRDGYRPLWDAPENDKGGAWSKKVDAHDTHTVLIDCMVHCMANTLLKQHNESVVGVTVSPKGHFHIIKVWNNLSTVSDRKLFSPTLKMKLGDDIAYKAHNLRPK